jgi:hypothetical protein
MPKIVKIANGEASVSEVVTYGLKKKVNAALFRGRMLDTSGSFQVSYENMEESKMVGMLGLVEKLTINGENVPVTQENLEALTPEDHDAIALAVSSVLNPAGEAKKKTS